MLRERLFYILIFFVAALPTARPIGGQKPSPVSLEPKAHPNHYILLVDASGSTVESRRKAESYRRALGQLAERLYGKGFGDSVPPYDPEQDFLTLLHFGVVDSGDAASAYQRLRRYDLLTHLVHPRFVRRPGVKQDELEDALYPDRHFRLTVLRWADALALSASVPPAGPPSEGQRTFLIKVYDGIPNEGTLSGEVDLVRRWGDPTGFQVAAKRVEAVENAYSFPERQAEEVRAHSDAPPVFVAAHEVLPRQQEAWTRELTAMEPFTRAEFTWVDESREGATGRLALELAPALVRLLAGTPAALEVTGTSLSGSASWKEASRPAVAVPAVYAGRLPCEARPVKVRLSASPRRSDPLLGASTFEYFASRSVLAPAPYRCSVPHRVKQASMTALSVVLLTLLAFVVCFRRFSTLLQAKLPGMGRLVRLQWDRPIEHRTSLAVNPGSQFLRLHLPHFLVQALVYWGAVVRVSGPAAPALRWSHDTGPEPVRLPVRKRTLSLLWKDGEPAAESVEISFDIGPRVARLCLGRTPASPQGGSEA